MERLGRDTLALQVFPREAPACVTNRVAPDVFAAAILARVEAYRHKPR
jgi:hypothetical protein